MVFSTFIAVFSHLHIRFWSIFITSKRRPWGFPGTPVAETPRSQRGWNEWRSLSPVWPPHRPWNSPGQNTGLGSHSLLQGIFPTQGSYPGLPHCRRILYQLSHQGSPPMQCRGPRSVSGWGTRSHIPKPGVQTLQLKIPRACHS